MTKVDSEGWIQWNGGKMPVEQGTLIDVKYRDGQINEHVKAGFVDISGTIAARCAGTFTHYNRDSDIVAYRLHAKQDEKTPQQLALEKFGTDWHDNEGVQPVDDGILVDFEIQNKKEFGLKASYYDFRLTQSIPVTKWRIHSDVKESQADHGVKPLAFDDGPMASEPVSKSQLSTQVGGNHYTKLAIQPMRYSMENRLDALQHTVIKYVTRFRDKNGIEDLEKAKHCIDMLIEFERESK